MSWLNLDTPTQTTRLFREFLRDPGATGAVAPSSPHLAERIVEWIDWRRTRTLLEWGPGTGSFTELILQRKPPSTRYLALELSSSMCDLLHRRFPGIEICQESVVNVFHVCQCSCIDEVDCVVSGLPWASFSDELQTQFLDALMCVLRSGGQFTTFAYIHGLSLPAGQRFRNKLFRYFSQVSQSPTVWRNLPPAFVYRCRR